MVRYLGNVNSMRMLTNTAVTSNI